MSLQALHKASKAEIEAITLAHHHRTTWSIDQTPRIYRAAAIPDEEPVIPAPRVFESLADPLADGNENSQSGLPSIGECATHLELLEVFFKLRSDILHRTSLDTVFGIKQEHRVVYRLTASWKKREPVKLKDTNWDEKRRMKWEYVVSLSVARFELWAERAGFTVTGDSEALQLPYLPPLDILMVWHAFLLNPKSFKHYCNTPNLKRLRQVPFPWLEIHNAIDRRNMTFTLPKPSALWYRTIFHLPTDLLAYLTTACHTPISPSDPLLRATALFGSGTISTTKVCTVLSSPAATTAPLPTQTFLTLIYATQRNKTHYANLAANVHRQASFVDKMHLHLWLRAPSLQGTLRRSIARYDDFVRLFGLYPDTMLVPTLDIDLAWHTHQLSAVQYQQDMMERTGRFIDHDDKIGKGKLSGGLGKTRELWKIRVGGEYERCFCWDCEGILDALDDGEEQVEGVVQRVRREVEYHRVVERARRTNWVLLPVRCPEGEEQELGVKYLILT